MPGIARIPITNIYMGGDYTGQIFVGPEGRPMNVILDTGSSALALDGHKYKPDLANGDESTHLAQTDAYGDGSSWTGAVIQTKLTVGTGSNAISLSNGNAAIAYTRSANMFRRPTASLILPMRRSTMRSPCRKTPGGTNTPPLRCAPARGGPSSPTSRSSLARA